MGDFCNEEGTHTLFERLRRYDNILIEKIWEDDGFFEAMVTCSNAMIIANTKVYISDENWEKLQDQLSPLLNDQNVKEVYWESGIKGGGGTTCVSFLFSEIDLQGQVRMEAFMEIEDGGKLSKHHCCFYVYTGKQQLHHFLEQLQSMVNSDIGYRASLAE